jgi:hypothetical protein
MINIMDWIAQDARHFILTLFFIWCVAYCLRGILGSD